MLLRVTPARGCNALAKIVVPQQSRDAGGKLLGRIGNPDIHAVLSSPGRHNRKRSKPSPIHRQGLEHLQVVPAETSVGTSTMLVSTYSGCTSLTNPST